MLINCQGDAAKKEPNLKIDTILHIKIWNVSKLKASTPTMYKNEKA